MHGLSSCHKPLSECAFSFPEFWLMSLSPRVIWPVDFEWSLSQTAGDDTRNQASVPLLRALHAGWPKEWWGYGVFLIIIQCLLD